MNSLIIHPMIPNISPENLMLIKQLGGNTKMSTMKDKALGYEAKSKVKNISELPSVETNVVCFSEENVEFPYDYIEIGNERYRVPASVWASLKAILEENPNLKKFKVKKTGEGMETRYTVIPLA